MRRAALLLACAIVLLVGGCGRQTRTPSTPAKAKSDGVTELRDIGQLRAAFNAHGGVPRLIVLASPT
jgi:hypothetical protein